MGKSYVEIIGWNVRRRRYQLKLTQVELCEAAFVSRATLQRIEDGSGNPEMETIEVLARTLGLTVPELFKEEAV